MALEMTLLEKAVMSIRVRRWGFSGRGGEKKSFPLSAAQHISHILHLMVPETKLYSTVLELAKKIHFD